MIVNAKQTIEVDISRKELLKGLIKEVGLERELIKPYDYTYYKLESIDEIEGISCYEDINGYYYDSSNYKLVSRDLDSVKITAYKSIVVLMNVLGLTSSDLK